MSSTHSSSLRVQIGLCLGLAILTAFLYWPTRQHDFVNFDDDYYVTNNPMVLNGMTRDGFAEAWTTFRCANWHPLTWLSLMLDSQLLGTGPAGFHLVNLLFHAANTVLLFLVLSHMTGHSWPSAFVAALFAVHPLHVESVAWVAERKDVLSTFFWMLVLWSYSHYARHPRWSGYLAVCLFLTLGLLAKPMLVTLPCVLLLCDIWPLGRWNLCGINTESTISTRRLFLEKAPLFLLVVGFSIITFIAQRSEGAVGNLVEYTFSARITNSVAAYATYLGKTFWPTRLAVFYPFGSNNWPIALVIGAGLLLVGVTAVTVRFARQRPAVLVGWLWYLGTLVPVIGLVQVGKQSMADRYTYIPLIGVFIMLAWGLPRSLFAERTGRIIARITAGGIITALVLVSSLQISHWKNSTTLFEHTLAVTQENWLAHLNYGVELEKARRHQESLSHYQEAIRIKPTASKAHNNLGVVFSRLGKPAEGERHSREAIRLEPTYVSGHVNLASILLQLNQYDEALEHCHEAIRLKPDSIEGHVGLGILYAKKEQYDDSLKHFREVEKLSPHRPRLRTELGKTLLALNNVPGAIAELKLALQANPKDVTAHYHLAKAFALQNKLPEAIQHCREAVRLKPDDPDGQKELERLLQLQRDKALLTDK